MDNIMTLDQVKNLQKEDAVFLHRWTNKRDGTRRPTTDKNVLVTNIQASYIQFHGASTRPGKEPFDKFDDYGKTWSVEPVKNSYA